ncbi:hypothetical protein B0H67DRAFT_549628 [Lasiosphaeris hirsuta]|uniref:Uncharacterized protein n=1 Tax=Lasiosphaeris hirsuta TaxID=260670 RepID=A0AA40EE46_9PEZI|nr:hypothetical protein B0H67DRAFT_549628 [Lasiosphaeris hirsuta]
MASPVPTAGEGFKPEPKIKQEPVSHWSIAAAPAVPTAAHAAAAVKTETNPPLAYASTGPASTFKQKPQGINAHKRRRKPRSRWANHILHHSGPILIRIHYNKRYNLVEFTISAPSIRVAQGWKSDVAEAAIFKRLERLGFAIEPVVAEPCSLSRHLAGYISTPPAFATGAIKAKFSIPVRPKAVPHHRAARTQENLVTQGPGPALEQPPVFGQKSIFPQQFVKQQDEYEQEPESTQAAGQQPLVQREPGSGGTMFSFGSGSGSEGPFIKQEPGNDETLFSFGSGSEEPFIKQEPSIDDIPFSTDFPLGSGSEEPFIKQKPGIDHDIPISSAFPFGSGPEKPCTNQESGVDDIPFSS